MTRATSASICPAAAGKVRCPHKAASLALSFDAPERVAPADRAAALLRPGEHHRCPAGERKDPSKARLRRTGASRLLCPAHRGRAHLRLVGRSLRRRDPPGLVPPVRPGQEHPHVCPRRRRAQRAHRRVLRTTKGPRGPGPIHRSDTPSQKASSARRPCAVGAAGARGSNRSRIADTAHAPHEAPARRTSSTLISSRAHRRARARHRPKPRARHTRMVEWHPGHRLR